MGDACEVIKGAEVIEAKIKEIFLASNRTVSNIQWNVKRSGEILNYTNHTIYITVLDHTFELKDIPMEQIMNYPGGVGNEKLDLKIRNLASSSLQNTDC